MLAHDTIGPWGVLDDSSLLHAAFDAPSIRRPCTCEAEASDGVVNAKSQSKLVGCTPKMHTVDVCIGHARECKSIGSCAIMRVGSK